MHIVEKDNYHCAGHVLAIYLIMAVTSWNKPDESKTAMYQSEYQHI